MRQVAVIASGPSLTVEDCEVVRRSGISTVAVNSSWRAAPWASVLYAGDSCWWENYGREAAITAEHWTASRQAAIRYGINYHRSVGLSNSGARAIRFALERGADQVILLGFDCSVADGTHWHGDHPATGNPDAARCRQWMRDFLKIAAEYPGRVVNCSRRTALDCFPRSTVGELLEPRTDS